MLPLYSRCLTVQRRSLESLCVSMRRSFCGCSPSCVGWCGRAPASAPVAEVPVAWLLALILHGLGGIGLQQWKRGAASSVQSDMRCATTDLCCVEWFITCGPVWIGGWGQFWDRKFFCCCWWKQKPEWMCAPQDEPYIPCFPHCTLLLRKLVQFN